MSPDPRPHPPASTLTQAACAVVLAGGRGSRLRQLTDWCAKPAMPFGGQLRIIDFALSNCINSGIRRIAVLTQYKSQSLIRHVTRGWGFLDAALGEFVDVVPAQQRVDASWYSGTANAVWQNLDMIRELAPRWVVVLAGDHVYKMDYGVMLAEHVRSGAAVTIACVEVPVEEARAFGVLQVDAQGRVCAFEEKPAEAACLPGCPGRVLASMGIYVFDTALLCEALQRDAMQAGSSHDFGRDVIPALLGRVPVAAHPFAHSCVNMVDGRPYWRDVGTLDAYWEANMDLVRPLPELNLYDESWPVRGLPQSLPPAKFVFDADNRRGQALDSLVASGCIVSGASVRRSVLFSGVRVEEGSVIEDSLLLQGVRVGRGVRLRRAIVDQGCVLPDGLCVGLDPGRDGAGFTVSERGITLVTAAMLAHGAREAVAA